MELWRIAVRAVIAYVYLLVMTRASGKSTVSQATPFDFIVSLILGDLIDDALWADVPIAKFGAAAGTIVFCDLAVKLAAFRSPAFFRLVSGIPRVVMRDGREDGDALRREQFNEGDLEHLLHTKGIDREHWTDVHVGTLELDHELSIIPTPDAEPATKAMKEQLP